MKLLIITQKVDQADSNLGFFHRWLLEFSKNTDELFVIGGSVGSHALASSVHVYSLGKEKGYNRLIRYIRFYWYCIMTIPRVDAVFIHMIPAWALLVSPVAFIFRKKIFFWYTHKSVTLSLRIAARLVTRIFTASKESCRVSATNIMVTGHGIDVDHFAPRAAQAHRELKLLTVGRITHSKDILFLLEVIQALRKKDIKKNIVFDIVGGTITSADNAYKNTLDAYIATHQLADMVHFIGERSYQEMPDVYNSYDLMLHASVTGSVDKVVIEGMACGLPVITTSEVYGTIVPSSYILARKDPALCAEKIYALQNTTKDLSLRDVVVRHHNVIDVVKRIAERM